MNKKIITLSIALLLTAGLTNAWNVKNELGSTIKELELTISSDAAGKNKIERRIYYNVKNDDVKHVGLFFGGNYLTIAWWENEKQLRHCNPIKITKIAQYKIKTNPKMGIICKQAGTAKQYDSDTTTYERTRIIR